MSNSPDLQRLIQAHRRGGSLAQAFYQDPEVFEAEVDSFLEAHWIVAGHVAEIPERGDYFVFDALTASVIVVRGADGEINALHNVCRHRGAKGSGLEPRAPAGITGGRIDWMVNWRPGATCRRNSTSETTRSGAAASRSSTD